MGVSLSTPPEAALTRHGGVGSPLVYREAERSGFVPSLMRLEALDYGSRSSRDRVYLPLYVDDGLYQSNDDERSHLVIEEFVHRATLFQKASLSTAQRGTVRRL